MTTRRLRPPAPGPLEDYAARFDDLSFSLAQTRGFRGHRDAVLAMAQVSAVCEKP